MDECNLESHGSWDGLLSGVSDYDMVVPGDKKEWMPLLLDRANSMYMRDRNHSSILIWSCGNESYGGSDIYEMSEFFRKKDSSRLVHYEGVFNDRRYNDTSDIESRMYAKVADVKEFLKTHRDKPFIECEYTHAMGRSFSKVNLSGTTSIKALPVKILSAMILSTTEVILMTLLPTITSAETV